MHRGSRTVRVVRHEAWGRVVAPIRCCAAGRVSGAIAAAGQVQAWSDTSRAVRIDISEDGQLAGSLELGGTGVATQREQGRVLALVSDDRGCRGDDGGE